MKKYLPILLVFVVSGCSDIFGGNDRPDPGLYTRLLTFQANLNEPILEKYYGGISFNGMEVDVTNLTVFALGPDNEARVRAALESAFNEVQLQHIRVEIWEDRPTFASEQLKSCCWVEHMVFSDYDETVDRMRFGVKNLNAVSEIERLMAEQEISREAVIIVATGPIVSF